MRLHWVTPVACVQLGPASHTIIDAGTCAARPDVGGRTPCCSERAVDGFIRSGKLPFTLQPDYAGQRMGFLHPRDSRITIIVFDHATAISSRFLNIEVQWKTLSSWSLRNEMLTCQESGACPRMTAHHCSGSYFPTSTPVGWINQTGHWRNSNQTATASTAAISAQSSPRGLLLAASQHCHFLHLGSLD